MEYEKYVRSWCTHLNHNSALAMFYFITEMFAIVLTAIPGCKVTYTWFYWSDNIAEHKADLKIIEVHDTINDYIMIHK